jgi:hypothetical protein
MRAVARHRVGYFSNEIYNAYFVVLIMIHKFPEKHPKKVLLPSRADLVTLAQGQECTSARPMLRISAVFRQIKCKIHSNPAKKFLTKAFSG